MMARNISGLWTVIQTNGARVSTDVENFKPDGSFDVEAVVQGTNVEGRGTGRVDGEQVHFTIKWNNNSTGAYHGAFDGGGVLHGSTFDIKNPAVFAGWHSSRAF